MTEFKPDVTYLSTTDYVQHKFGPAEQGALDFYAMFDRYIGALHDSGAHLVITADHGMNAKHTADGKPDILFLQDAIDARFGPGAAKVILPITDPYVVHHGALGSYAAIYCRAGSPAGIAAHVRTLAGIDLVLPRAEACARFGLPPDRTADLVVCAGGPQQTRTLGTTAASHDLSGLDRPLRSHGGLGEQRVPMFFNRPVDVSGIEGEMRSFDAFFLACNGMQ